MECSRIIESVAIKYFDDVERALKTLTRPVRFLLEHGCVSQNSHEAKSYEKAN